MRALWLSLLLVAFVPVSLCARNTPKVVKIQVITSRGSERQFTYVLPGRNGTSNTNCNTNATGSSTGDYTTINGTTSCTTTSTPSTPATSVVSSIAQEHVYAIMPDDSHVTLWCQAGFRRCSSLQAGYYSAEIKGNSLFIVTHDLSGKAFKVKYHAVGGW